MTFNFDTSELTQTAARRVTPHDNCVVTELSSGTFPRYIKVQLPDDDGPQQVALWDGSLDLEVNDEVYCHEYAEISIWRVMAMGGNDSGAGKHRVSKVWASDFSSVSLQTDASDNVTINTGTLTLPSDIIHLSDPDTLIGLTDDDVEITVGGLSMLKLTEAGQDLITLGPGAGDVDVNFNGDMFLRGSDGALGIGIAVPSDAFVHISKTITSASVNERGLKVEPTFDGAGDGAAGMSIQATHTPSVSPSVVYGAIYQTTYNPPVTVTITNAHSFWTRNVTGNDAGAVTQANGIFVAAPSLGTIKPTTTTGVTIQNQGGAGITNTIGLTVSAQSGSTNNHAATFDGNVGIGTTSPAAKLHTDQASTTAAIPVLLLDQADVSEEMRQFETTIGIGNAIELSGSKLLTVTHFVKDTLPGGLTRYTPYGTISTTGPKFSRTETVTTQGLGANPDIFAFGSYEFSVADANLTQASTTQTFGTANISYAAHAFSVTGGAGTVDTGVVGLRVNGTSINDQGTRTTSDTETIIADITAAALDDYQETSKKWLGQVTYELFTVSGSPTTFSLDFNYGIAKYDDWFNTDFTITDVQATGFAGANDSDFDIKLMHHQTSGWTYSAAAFTPITAANTVVSLATDHSTDDQLASSQHMAWKRDNLSEVIDGADGEGFLFFVSSSANNAVEYLNLTVGVIF